MDLNGKNALVTGAAKRLGRAIAIDFARLGCNIALHYGSSLAEAKATAKEIKALGVACRLYRADLSKAGQVKRLAQSVLRDFKACHILVNSASVFPQVGLAKAKVSDFDLPYFVNLRAPALLTQAIGLAMARKKIHSRIINIADVGGQLAWPGYLPYSLSKAALLQLTRTSALALAPYVLVNSVSPGPMLMPKGHLAAQKRASLRRTVLGRLGGADEIAKTVSFVAQSDFMTGSDVVVDGGRKLVG